MKISFFSFLVLILLPFSNADDSHLKMKLVSEITDLSGLEKQTLSLKDVLRQQVNLKMQEDNELPAKEKESLNRIIISEFKEKEVLKEIELIILKKFTLEELNALSRLYKQELFRKISRLEEESGTPEGLVKMQKFAQNLNKVPPTKQKVQTMIMFDKALAMTDFITDIVFTMMKGLIQSFSQVKVNEKDLLSIKPQIKQKMTNVIIVQLLYIYKDLKDKEIKKYINFQKTNKLLVKLSNIYKAELLEAFKVWGENIGKKAKKILPKKK